eukprot:m.354548 g.354548  ORF g.354548 m.354548 type:complete len:293 (+) comp28002_c0_seq24:18-896(+)
MIVCGLAVAMAVATADSDGAKLPSIVFIVSDDLGYNDVSFHGSTQIPTPNLDGLAHSGAILSHYFVQPVCSPTRATFATGRHVIHTGVYDPMNGGSGDLSLNFSLWSNGFQKLGYSTHAIGKWHIGMSSWRFTPLERGFGTYYGYLGGGEDYWTHVDGGAIELFDGRDPVTNASCAETKGGNINSCPIRYYSADLFTERAVRVINDAATEEAPFFLYLAYQSVRGQYSSQYSRVCLGGGVALTRADSELCRCTRRTKLPSTSSINSMQLCQMITAERLPEWWRRWIWASARW